MSYTNYYSPDPGLHPPHRGGINGWGTVLIVFGALLALLVLFGCIGIVFMAAIRSNTGNPNLRLPVILASLLFEAGFAGVLIWIGIAMLRGRRWTAPVVAAFSVLSIAGSLAAVCNYAQILAHASSLPSTPAAGSPFSQSGIAIVTSIASGLMIFGIGVVLPVFMFRFFTKPGVLETFARLDPGPRWTDRVPLPLLIWVAACVCGGGSYLISVAGGILPLFTKVIDGPPAILIGLIFSIVMVGGGLLCIRRSMIGWLMTVAATGLLAASMGVFSIAGDWNAYKTALTRGMNPNEKQTVENMLPDHLMLSTAFMYAVACGYGIWVKSRFSTVSAAVPIEVSAAG